MNPLLVSGLKERGFKFKARKVRLRSGQQEKAGHTHDWKRYKKSLGYDKRIRHHTVIYIACEGCKTKQAVDLIVKE